MNPTFTARLTYKVTDPRKFARQAWKAAQDAGFATKAEFRETRRKRGLAWVLTEILDSAIAPYDAGLLMINAVRDY